MEERDILIFMGQFSLVLALVIASFLVGGLAGALIFAVIADFGLRRMSAAGQSHVRVETRDRGGDDRSA